MTFIKILYSLISATILFGLSLYAAQRFFGDYLQENYPNIPLWQLVLGTTFGLVFLANVFSVTQNTKVEEPQL